MATREISRAWKLSAEMKGFNSTVDMSKAIEDLKERMANITDFYKEKKDEL
jgi:hypothetical protein